MVHKGEQGKLSFNHDANIAAAAVSKKAHHRMKRH